MEMLRLEAGILRMDFEDSSARDATFEIKLDEAYVTLTDADGVTNESYILNKVRD